MNKKLILNYLERLLDLYRLSGDEIYLELAERYQQKLENDE